MTNPLDFDFEAFDDQPGVVGRAAFAEAHPRARYVVLRVDDLGELADLVRDFQNWPAPEHALHTPCQENQVHAVPLAVLDTWGGWT